MTVVGRGGIGKTAMVCRLLRSLEGGQLPDDGGPLTVDGIVYLSAARSLPPSESPRLVCRPHQAAAGRDCQAARFRLQESRRPLRAQRWKSWWRPFRADGRWCCWTISRMCSRSRPAKSRMPNWSDALRALLELPPHGLKIIITTRVAPADLPLVQPGLQRRLNLDTGLEYPYAENILKAMDVDGKVGLRDAPVVLLARARERTRGYPRALEHLFGILSADRDTSLGEILDNTRNVLPEQVVTVLVGEAYSRLDPTAQRVMQALATYRYPVPPAAVDYLLQPHVPGIDSGPVLGRLVNMQFVSRDAGRYYLHQVDRDYALSRIEEGDPGDRDTEAALPDSLRPQTSCGRVVQAVS